MPRPACGSPLGSEACACALCLTCLVFFACLTCAIPHLPHLHTLILPYRSTSRLRWRRRRAASSERPASPHCPPPKQQSRPALQAERLKQPSNDARPTAPLSSLYSRPLSCPILSLLPTRSQHRQCPLALRCAAQRPAPPHFLCPARIGVVCLFHSGLPLVPPVRPLCFLARAMPSITCKRKICSGQQDAGRHIGMLCLSCHAVR